MSLFLAALRFQLTLAWRSPDMVQIWLTAPLLTLIFLAMSEHAGRSDLAPYGVVAPTLMSLWTAALFAAGELIADERIQGTLEGLVASPARLPTVVFGRLAAVVGLGLFSFLEAWLIALLVFGRRIPIAHPGAVAVVLLLSAWATVGTASILSPLFVLVPSARIIQNTLSYPFYLLSGVLVPVDLLPVWIRPASHLVFLSWSADLLRRGLSTRPLTGMTLRLAALVCLGLLGYLAGTALLNRVLRRVRRDGSLSHV